MTKLELEAALEDRCVAKVEARGGLALKLRPPTERGFFDRTALIPQYNAWFFEVKRVKGGKISSQQLRWQVLLHQMGFGAYFIDTDEQFDAAMERELSR